MMSTQHTDYIDDPLQFYMTQCKQKEQDLSELLRRLEQAQEEIKELRRKVYLRNIQ